MSRAYLTVAEVADAFELSRRGAYWRVANDELPALYVGDCIRVEAQAVCGGPDPIPTHPELSIDELATWWRVSRRTLARLIADGQLATRREGGTLYVSRREILRFVLDHSRGDVDPMALLHSEGRPSTSPEVP